MCCHINRDRECPVLPQSIHDALQVNFTDETIIVDKNPLRILSNATNSDQLFCINHHLCHLMEIQSNRQIFCNQLKLISVVDGDGIPTGVVGIGCIR